MRKKTDEEFEEEFDGEFAHCPKCGFGSQCLHAFHEHTLECWTRAASVRARGEVRVLLARYSRAGS